MSFSPLTKKEKLRFSRFGDLERFSFCGLLVGSALVAISIAILSCAGFARSTVILLIGALVILIFSLATRVICIDRRNQILDPVSYEQ